MIKFTFQNIFWNYLFDPKSNLSVYNENENLDQRFNYFYDALCLLHFSHVSNVEKKQASSILYNVCTIFHIILIQ